MVSNFSSIGLVTPKLDSFKFIKKQNWKQKNVMRHRKLLVVLKFRKVSQTSNSKHLKLEFLSFSLFLCYFILLLFDILLFFHWDHEVHSIICFNCYLYVYMLFLCKQLFNHKVKPFNHLVHNVPKYSGPLKTLQHLT